MILEYNDFIFENVKYTNNPIIVHVHNQEEFNELMFELDKEDFCWSGNIKRPATSEKFRFNTKANYILLNFNNIKTIFAIDYNTLIDLKSTTLKSFKVVEFENKRKKITRPDIDPFDEEDWGYEIQEN